MGELTFDHDQMFSHPIMLSFHECTMMARFINSAFPVWRVPNVTSVPFLGTDLHVTIYKDSEPRMHCSVLYPRVVIHRADELWGMEARLPSMMVGRSLSNFLLADVKLVSGDPKSEAVFRRDLVLMAMVMEW